MIFNFTNDHKFTTSLQVGEKTLEVVDQAKLFGVLITNDLKWDQNTTYLVKKAYSRMELLRKVAEFTTTVEDKRNIYVQYIRNILEQSCAVWHSSLTIENSEDLERVQKSAVRIILGSDYKGYDDARIKVNLDALEERREYICKNFAKKSIKSENVRSNEIFKEREKIHSMKTRNEECFEVNYAKTERYKKSAIPYMQKLLNCEENMKNSDENGTTKGVKRKMAKMENERIKRRKPG